MPDLFFRFRLWIFYGFIGISVVLMLSIESIFNGGFYFSTFHLWLPLACIIFGYAWWYRAYFERVTKSRFKPWVNAIAMYPIVLLMIWPYVMGLNALTGSDKTITFHGPIQNKWMRHGRYGGCQIEILDDTTHQKVTLVCTSSEYASFSTGEVVSKQFRIGGFGIPYRWRF